ncbi:MAG: 5'-methylthioadenosine nucleosidase, partial [Clostridia bacterium]|nr:5'-methylthioadenosine nucleosidase [Clostridia bacterium]
MKKIGMIAAMEKELSPLLSSLGEITEICALPYPVKLLKTNKAEVYLLQSGVGELAAAGATQYLITALGCDTIWNFGVVGGLTEEMDVNRTV